MAKGSTKTPPLRAAMLGAGYISEFHVKAAARNPAVQVAAICDLNEPAAHKLQQHAPEALIYTDYAHMLSETKPDVVHILTQPDSHFALAKQALEAGCHVLAEKPVTTTAEEAEALGQIAHRVGRRIAVKHNFLFSRPFNALHELLARGELGPLKSVHIVWKKPLAQATFGPWNLWMLREPGNMLFEIGSHSLSELLAVVPDPKVVRVEPRKPIRLPSGSIFYRRWELDLEASGTSVHIEIYFDEGYLQHYVEVEGLFGVARADIENDVFTVDQPTGRAYDAERFHVNLRAGMARVKQSFVTYGSYGASKFVQAATGGPYESSMLNGVDNCYALLQGQSARRESSLDYALSVTRTCEALRAAIPKAPDEATLEAAPSVPRPVASPGIDAKILIVGASGFIGKRLLLALKDDPRGVRALVRNASNLVGVELTEHCEVMVGDYRDEATMERVLPGVEVVFHLAVAHGNSLEAYLKADSEPTVRFAKQCQRHGIKRFIYAGTIDSLDLASPRRLTESDGVDGNLKQRNNYAHSKAITERELSSMHANEGFPLVIVRPAIVLGVGGPVTHLGVANWFGLGRCAYWGRGDNALPIVLVDDVVQALRAAASAEHIEGRVYNLSAEPSISAREYVAEVERVLGARILAEPSKAVTHFAGDFAKWGVKLLARHPDRVRVPSLHDWKCREQHASFDTSAAQQDLGFQPENDRETILEKGVREPARRLVQR